jgi:hypothetical protein
MLKNASIPLFPDSPMYQNSGGVKIPS